MRRAFALRIAASAALALSAVAAGASASAAASNASPTVFRGSYTLDSRAHQATYNAGRASCFPGVVQRETLSVSWVVKFPNVSGLRLLARGRLALPATSFHVSGTHVWDEASTACAKYKAGHLVCRSHFSGNAPRLVLVLARGRVVVHPDPGLFSNSDGCKGEVFNEHPDCGSRDKIGITDFGFRHALSAEAPQVAAEVFKQGTPTAKAFDVRRHGSCTKHGIKNPELVQQSVTARYRGSLMFGR